MMQNRAFGPASGLDRLAAGDGLVEAASPQMDITRVVQSIFEATPAPPLRHDKHHPDITLAETDPDSPV